MRFFKLFVAFASVILSTSVLAERLTLTKAILYTGKSNGVCYADILKVPAGVMKHYIAMEQELKGGRSYYKCYVFLVHNENHSLVGKSITYLAFKVDRFKQSGREVEIATPSQVLKVKISGE